jgi:hypothetical protein
MNVESNPPRGRYRKRFRDLGKAETLRPREIYERFGIPESTLSGYFFHPDPRIRLESILIPGRKGRKGIRLVFRADLEAWLGRWRASNEGAA